LYEPTSLDNPLPGALLYESTTLDTSTTGQKTVVGLSVTSTFGYLWACVVFNSPGSMPIIRRVQILIPTFGRNNTFGFLSDTRTIPRLSSVTGAFPNPANFGNWNAGVAVSGNTLCGIIYTVEDV
jgi:hypothetical protein